jgi:hypothetical protein
MPLGREERLPHQPALTWFIIFQRLVAVGCVLAGLKYWALLIGLHPGGEWRFDLMPAYWQIAATSLAVLFPVTAVGLWMPVSWGPVIWAGAAGGELVMHLGFPHLFGTDTLMVVVHCMVAAIYVVFRIVLFLDKRRSRQPVRPDSL